MCGNYRYLVGFSGNEFSFIKEQYIYRMMSHAFCKGFWSKNSHIMCGKTYVKKFCCILRKVPWVAMVVFALSNFRTGFTTDLG